MDKGIYPLVSKNSYLNTDCKNRVLANIPNSQSNVYIKQGTDTNGETCFDAQVWNYVQL